ncbi:hypothetical protein T09_12309 [Trichinella sp. T9]|nr:hypothetical protein T09_12309 [Trichinella sp. T9]
MDPTSDQISSTNDSSRTMTSQRSRTRTYDSEGTALKYWIDQLQELCTGPTDIEAIHQVTGTLRHTTQLFFDSRQRHLDSMPEEERDAAIIEFDELIEKLKTTQRQADELLATAETSSSAEITQPPATKNHDTKTNSTMPILKLPTFDGDILQFKAFWDQFNAAVHRREDLEDVTKFVHLRSCLAGAALHAISGVTTAAENYPAVVQLLHDRFYRVSDILDAHILKIFSVTKEVAKGKEGLLALHDKLNGHLLELRAIGRDLDTTVSGFRTALPQLVAQLPKNIQSRWKDQCGKLTEEPTSQSFLDFLAEQARCAVDLKAKKSTQGERISSPTHKQTLSENRRKRPRPQRQTIAAFHTSLLPICPVCQGKHRVTVCQRFLNQQRSERKTTAVRLGLCFICLSQGHTSQRCMMRQRGWRTHHLLTETAPNRRTSQPKPSDTSITPPAKKTRSEPSDESHCYWPNGQRLTVNCLFDSGAETTLVTEEVARALNLVETPETVTVKGIGGIQCAPTVARRVRFRLSPVDTNQSGVGDKPIEALTLPRICDDIHSVPVRCDEWKHLQHLQLPEEEDEKLPINVGYETLIRVTAYCLRFARNCQSPASERTTDVNLSVKELWNAETIWLREIQVTEFGTKHNSSERVRVFEPFLDRDGLLRMGGRLRRSTLPPESKHPIILPNNHPVTELLIKDHHVRQMHAGVNQTLVVIRTKFWIIRARNAVKKIIRSCPVCRRVETQPYRLRMSDLPADRVTESPPFSHTGVDFAGPLFVRPEGQGRNARVNKAYVCIFTCMTTRAAFGDLFPAEADPEDSDWEKLQRKLNEERIRWKFITPRAPWCGGYWERLIQKQGVQLSIAIAVFVPGAMLCCQGDF